MDGGADVLSSGRDPDQPSWWRAHQRLVAAAAAVALICAGVTVWLLRPGGPYPLAGAVQEQAAAVMLHGEPFRPNPRLGTLLFGGGAELRQLNVSDGVPGAPGLVPGLLGSTGASSLGPGPTVREIAPAAGGVVVLVSGEANTGAVFFIPVSPRGAGTPRLIGHGNYLAVALNRRDFWVEQAGASPGRAWLVDESGRRLSAALRLHGQVLLGATVRGLLVQGPSGEGASLISPASGRVRSAGVPDNALVVAVGAADVAWQAASCGGPCSLHITSLRTGTDTVIPLPPRTLPITYDPPPTAFDLTGQRLALAMETANREDRTTGTWVYVADIGQRRLIRLPGGPVPLSAIPARLGAVPAGNPDIVSVHWAGSGLWVVATNGVEAQAAYWAGAGPLRVTAPLPGAAYTFSVASTR